MAQEDKPGMGLSGAVTGIVGAGVGTGGTALFANRVAAGKLPEDAKKFLDEGLDKVEKDTKEAYVKEHPKPAEISKDLKGEAKTEAEKAYKKDLQKWEEGEKEAVEKARAAAKEAALGKLEGAQEAISKAKDEFAKKNPMPEKVSDEAVAEWQKLKDHALKGKEGDALKKAEEGFLKDKPHPNAKHMEWVKGEAKAVEEALEKVEGARALKGAAAVKEASLMGKPVAAFKAMSTGGKAGAVAVGAALAITGAMWMKARRQNAWQDRMDAERAAIPSQQPAR